MSIKKEQIFTMTAAFDMIKSAVQKVTKCDSAKTDDIIFNSLNKAIAKKLAKKETK